MTTGIWIGIDGIIHPWSTPPVLLERTTTECIWAAFNRLCPIKPWDVNSLSFDGSWLWMIFAADEASSNKKAFAISLASSSREKLLQHYSPCMLHILHRSVVPLMKRKNLISSFSAAATS